MAINLIQTTTELALHIARAYIGPGSTVVDATCGNGYDSLALARELMPNASATFTGKLYCFDLQPAAIDNTCNLLMEHGFADAIEDSRIEIINDSHERMREYLKAPADAIVFNLGYLPGGDKNITTCSTSTLQVVRDILGIDNSSAMPQDLSEPLLSKGGLLCITMYSGHLEGKTEKNELLNFAENLDSKLFHVAYISMSNQRRNPPEILLITIK